MTLARHLKRPFQQTLKNLKLKDMKTQNTNSNKQAIELMLSGNLEEYIKFISDNK